MRTGNGAKITPLGKSDFAVYRLPTHSVRARKNVYGQWGVRIGPNASRENSNRMAYSQNMPPDLRKSSPREILEILRARGQIGSPASMHTHACLGYSAMRNRTWGAPHRVLDARKFNLIRLVGPEAKGRDAEGNLAQKAKVGFCPCCEQATHIAVPSSFLLGGYSLPERTGHAALGGRRLSGGKTIGSSQLCLGQWRPSLRGGLGLGGQVPRIQCSQCTHPIHLPGSACAHPNKCRSRKIARYPRKEKNATAIPKDVHVTGVDECPLLLDSLLPLTEARVRKDKHTRAPAPTSADVSPEAASSSEIAHRRSWNTEGKGKKKGMKQSPDAMSSWSPRWNDWRE